VSNEGIELEVYSHSDPTQYLGKIKARQEPSYLEQLKATGNGSFKVNTNGKQIKAHPELIHNRVIIKHVIDGETIGAWILDTSTKKIISTNEHGDEIAQYAGPGLKGWLEDAFVLPEGGLKTSSKDTRSFSFASKDGDWYNPADWSNVTVMHRVHTAKKPWANGPDKWPEEALKARWVWSQDGTSAATPIGTSFFRIRVPISIAGTYSLYLSVDDYYTLYLNGEEIAKSDPEGSAWFEARKISLDLTTGTHTIGIRATTKGGQAGIALALYRTVESIDPISQGTCTMSASTDVITKNSHGLSAGQKVFFTTTGSLLAGISPNTDYYVRATTTNTFSLANSSGGPAIDLTGTQSGTHTLWKAEVPEQNKLITYSGMSVSELTTIRDDKQDTVDEREDYYTGLPAGNKDGTDAQKKQYKKKQDAKAAYQKAVQEKNAAQTELNIATAQTGITWKCQNYPSSDPGWSPGEILMNLLEESAARGVMMAGLLTPTFTTTEDSYGQPWLEAIDWEFKIGESLLSVAAKMEELVCDIWIDPADYSLHMVNSRGVDRSDYVYDVDDITVLESPIIFTRGKNLKNATIKTNGKIKNTLAIKTAAGWQAGMPDDPTSVAEYGVIEGVLDTGSSGSVSGLLAARIFAVQAQEEEGAQYEVWIPPEGKKPGSHYGVGDLVLAPDKNNLSTVRRIVSISSVEAENGQAAYTIEFDIVFASSDSRFGMMLRKLGQGGVTGGSANGGGSTPSSPTIPTTIPAPDYREEVQNILVRPEDLEIFSIGSWSADGVNALSQVNIVWEPVTENTDGSEAIPFSYTVWGRPNLETENAYVMFAEVTEPKAVIEGFVPGTEWTFKVYAVNSSGNISEPSEEVQHTMLGPTEPMDAPDTPTLSSNKGMLTVTWNGKLAGEDPPPQFRYVYAEISEDGSTGWTRMGAALSRDGRNIAIANLEVNEDYWARLVAVDGMGIASAPSSSATITLTGIDLGDLDESIEEAIDAAEEAGLAAREQLNILSDNSFELNTEEFWDLNTGCVNSNTDPHSGDRHLIATSTGSDFEAFVYQRPLPCEPGDQFYLRVWVKPGGTYDDDGLTLSVEHGEDESTTETEEFAPSGELTSGVYQMVSGVWLVPADTYFFRPRVMVTDAVASHTYKIDDIRMYRMTAEADIVNASITTDKLAAGSVVAEKIQAGAIATEHIQAGAIDTEKLQADSVTANEIAAGSIEANHIAVGAVQTSHISPEVGGELNLEANDSIQLVVGQIAGVEDDLNATSENLEEMQTYYQFGTDGAVISKPGSVFALALRNDTIEMLENGHVVSYWNSGVMYVDQFVGEVVTLGNHQIAKNGDGTVVRAL